MLAVGTPDSGTFHYKTSQCHPLFTIDMSSLQSRNRISANSNLQLGTNLKALAGPEDQTTVRDSTQLNDGLPGSAALASGVTLLVLAVFCHKDRNLKGETPVRSACCEQHKQDDLATKVNGLVSERHSQKMPFSQSEDLGSNASLSPSPRKFRANKLSDISSAGNANSHHLLSKGLIT